MALITDLPAASGLSNTDLLVIDTGSQTQKIQAQNAGASASNAGLVTTGTQTFEGTKTFNGTVKSGSDAVVGAVSSPTIRFECPIGTRWGDVALRTIATNGVQRSNDMLFRTWSYNSSTGAQIGYYDQYQLPEATPNKTQNDGYAILTTKDYSSNSSLTGVLLYKRNSIVQIAIRGANINSSGSIGTLPEGYRPPAYFWNNVIVNISGGYRYGLIAIESSGTTQIKYFNGSTWTTATSGDAYGNIVFVI